MGAQTPALAQGEATVLLLDTSASMRRGDLWQQALKAVEKRVEDLEKAHTGSLRKAKKGRGASRKKK